MNSLSPINRELFKIILLANGSSMVVNKKKLFFEFPLIYSSSSFWYEIVSKEMFLCIFTVNSPYNATACTAFVCSFATR